MLCFYVFTLFALIILQTRFQTEFFNKLVDAVFISQVHTIHFIWKNALAQINLRVKKDKKKRVKDREKCMKMQAQYLHKTNTNCPLDCMQWPWTSLLKFHPLCMCFCVWLSTVHSNMWSMCVVFLLFHSLFI